MMTADMDNIVKIIDQIVQTDPNDSQHSPKNWIVKKTGKNITPLPPEKSSHIWNVANDINATIVINALTEKGVIDQTNYERLPEHIERIVFYLK